VFQSVKIGDHTYVDGGLVSPVPVRFARQMGADFVIAVNISANPEAQAASSSSIDVLLQTFAIMGQTINQYELKNADIVLQPSLGAMKAATSPAATWPSWRASRRLRRPCRRSSASLVDGDGELIRAFR
jgi:predicted acylesterase/phospholipase RssA